MALTLSKTLFRYRRFLLVPNASWGLFPWEVDLAAMTPRGYVHEIEIKVSSGDLRRDVKKAKHELRLLPEYRHWFKYFWYAMPAQVLATVEATPPKLTLPADAGIITIADGQAKVVKPAQANPHARKLSQKQQLQLGRLGTMRYWTRAAA